mgnify:CR=1 FL=1
MNNDKDNVEVEIAIQYNDSYSDNTFSFVNNINTIEGGTHLSGLKTALTRSFNSYASKNFKDSSSGCRYYHQQQSRRTLDGSVHFLFWVPCDCRQ